MAKQLTDAQKEWIVMAIAQWANHETPEARITWDVVVEIVKTITGQSKTRAALSRHPMIKKAYENKRDGIKQPNKKDIQILNLKKEVERLHAENEALVEKLKTWAYNAQIAVRAPLDEDELNRPIPDPFSRG